MTRKKQNDKVQNTLTKIQDEIELKKQVLQQEAYPAMRRPADAQNSAIPGTIPPK